MGVVNPDLRFKICYKICYILLWPKSRRFAAIPSINFQKISVATYFRAVGKHETLPESRGFAAIPQLDTFNFNVFRAFSDETFRPILDQWFWTHGHFFLLFSLPFPGKQQQFSLMFFREMQYKLCVFVSMCPTVIMIWPRHRMHPQITGVYPNTKYRLFIKVPAQISIHFPALFSPFTI